MKCKASYGIFDMLVVRVFLNFDILFFVNVRLIKLID